MHRDFYRAAAPDEEPADDDSDVQRGREAVERAKKLLRADTATGRRTRVGLAALGGIGALAATAPVIAAVQQQPEVPVPDVAPAPSTPAQQAIPAAPMVAELAKSEERIWSLEKAVEATEKALRGGARPAAELEKDKSTVEALRKDAGAAVALTNDLLPALDVLGDEDATRRGHAARDQATALSARADAAWEGHQHAVVRARDAQRAAEAKAVAVTTRRAVDAAEGAVRKATSSLAQVRAQLDGRTPALQVEPALDAATRAVEEAGKLAEKAEQTSAGGRPQVTTVETAVQRARQELGELRAALDQAHETERLERARAASRTAAEAVRLARQAHGCGSHVGAGSGRRAGAVARRARTPPRRGANPPGGRARRAVGGGTRGRGGEAGRARAGPASGDRGAGATSCGASRSHR
ncbi:hypothetical protein JOF53_000649 [Crossiella equi]|uniref:Chromosome segregation protein SMC n=1 Tax=Crossiella equi TaxID=130796 RepID=A0ABS5A6A5_9PSEU|nr:hypothetical protein [Crossiella equi]MBP2471777.1 hypothetical protein [Crossiella equi]